SLFRPISLDSFRYFILHGYVHNRVLNSFPTRRSSDLIRQIFPDALDRAGEKTLEADGVIVDQGAVFTHRISSRELFRLSLLPVSDRKSTRLNSSHVKISYAVFCLKKKKKLY